MFDLNFKRSELSSLKSQWSQIQQVWQNPASSNLNPTKPISNSSNSTRNSSSSWPYHQRTRAASWRLRPYSFSTRSDEGPHSGDDYKPYVPFPIGNLTLATKTPCIDFGIMIHLGFYHNLPSSLSWILFVLFFFLTVFFIFLSLIHVRSARGIWVYIKITFYFNW